jgi:hypothetical protein
VAATDAPEKRDAALIRVLSAKAAVDAAEAA